MKKPFVLITPLPVQLKDLLHLIFLDQQLVAPIVFPNHQHLLILYLDLFLREQKEDQTGIDGDYEFNEQKFDEQLIDTDSDEQSNEKVVQKLNKSILVP